MFLLTFFQKTTAAVPKAILAVFGGSQASEGDKARSEKNGEFDHFVGGIGSGFVRVV